MRMLKIGVQIAAIALILAGCSKSDLDRCIDSQMAVWKQDNRSYEDRMKGYEPPYADDEMVNIGGVEIKRNIMVYPTGPGTKEEAEARANLRCGKIYAKNN